MRTMAIVSAVVVLFSSAASAAAPVEMTVDRLIDICTVSSIKDASAKGDALGWQRTPQADMSEWRSAFVKYNGGSVDVVGWDRAPSDHTDTLSFWVAVGPNAHQACAYSTKRPAGLMDALKARLGSPDTFDKMEEIETVTAFWKKNGMEYAFAQVGSAASIHISRNQ